MYCMYLHYILCDVFLFFLEVSSWIVCDGDIDPEWIESLNSVLDDNRLLTMPSGERIQFGPNVNFLFETHDLSCASPATISRMGMIFLRSVSLLSVYLYRIPFSQYYCRFFLPTLLPTYLFSDEDIDVGALLKSWLRGQPEECCGHLENWLGDYFQRALDWVLKQVTVVLPDFDTLAQKWFICAKDTLWSPAFGLDVETVLTWLCMHITTM